MRMIRLLGSVLAGALWLASCGGGEATEPETNDNTTTAAIPPTEPSTTTTSTSLPSTTTEPSTTTTLAALVPAEVLDDEVSRSRRLQLAEDLVRREGAPGRWVAAHAVDGDDMFAWIDLTGSMAESAGVSLDLEGEDNPLATLAALAPLAICQWIEEGVPLDDVRGAITDAVSPFVSDRSTAAYFPGFSGSIAKNIVCPEHVDAMNLQYAGINQQILADDFAREDSGWPVVSYDWGRVAYSSGFYRMLPDGSDLLLHSVLPDSHGNVVIDAWFRPIRGADRQTGYGIMCREDSSSGYLSGYLFQITTDGTYDVVRFSDNQFESLTSGRSDHFHVGDTWNHLTAICHGSRLALLVNGSLVAQADDDTHSDGKVGLASWSSGPAGADIVVEDFYLGHSNDEVLAMLDSVLQGD